MLLKLNIIYLVFFVIKYECVMNLLIKYFFIYILYKVNNFDLSNIYK